MDQYMQCPQCGGDLAILDDGKRQCGSCGKKYMLMTRPVTGGTLAADQTGEPVADQYNQCPQCGGDLVMLSDGKRQCQSCGQKYILVTRAAGAAAAADGVTVADGAEPVGKKTTVSKKASTSKKTSVGKKGTAKTSSAGKKRKKGFLGVVFLLVLAVLLGGAVAGYLGYLPFFDFPSGAFDRFDEKEYAAYCERMAGEELPMVSAGEIAEGLELEEGAPLQLMGVVDEVGENLIGLNNGVDCYFNPDALSDADLAALQALLGSLSVGDVVGVTGMVYDPSTASFSLKYCDVPYVYYGGEAYYNEYESFRNGGVYPDTVYSAEGYAYYMEQVASGDILYRSAVDVMDSFRYNDTVLAPSFYHGVDTYRNKVMYISGSVDTVADGYFVVDGIYCFYNNDLLTEEEQATIRSLNAGDFVSVCGWVSNPSVDSFRMSYCYVAEHVPAQDVSQDAEFYEWLNSYSGLYSQPYIPYDPNSDYTEGHGHEEVELFFELIDEDTVRILFRAASYSDSYRIADVIDSIELSVEELRETKKFSYAFDADSWGNSGALTISLLENGNIGFECDITQEVETANWNLGTEYVELPSATPHKNSIDEHLYNVLMGTEQFTNCGYARHDGKVPTREKQYSHTIHDGTESYATTSFAIVDVDGNGSREVVLFSEGASGNIYTVLHVYDGAVYGLMREYDTGQRLQKNGLFQTTDGAEIGRVERITFFGDDGGIDEWVSFNYPDDYFLLHYEGSTQEEVETYLDEIGFSTDEDDVARFYAYNRNNAEFFHY